MGVWAPAHSNTFLIFHLVGNNRLRLLSVGHHMQAQNNTLNTRQQRTQVLATGAHQPHICTSRQARAANATCP